MQTKTGRQIVVMGRTTTTTTPSGQRETCDRQRVAARRIVVIKDGQFVGGKTGR
jgi:hypothetical protein